MVRDIDVVEVFPWNRNFETGVKLIDAQHQQLVHLLNQLGAYLGQQSTTAELDEVLNSLAAYAEYHFEAEEQIWSKAFRDDPWFLAHKHTHDSFVEKVMQLKEEGESKPVALVFEDILKFLSHWLAFHILDSDKRMAKVLYGVESGLLLEQAKKQADIEMSGSTQVLVETVLSMYDNLSSRTLDLLRERSERKWMEAQLRAHEALEKRFSDAVINHVPGLIYLYDHEMRLVRWNQKFIDLSGFSAQELEQKPLWDLLPEACHHALQELLDQQDEEGYVEFEACLQSKSKNCLPVLFTFVPLMIDGQSYFAGVGIDISKQAVAEKESQEALLGVVSAVAKSLEIRDPYTAGHQQRVAEISVAVGEKIGLSAHQLEGLRLGASIHDIGKLGIPAEMLMKPARLTDSEYVIIKMHAQTGREILKDIKFPWPIVQIVSQHHERMDGSGYPLGLVGEEILLEARIVAVSDVFEAISSHRPYRAALGVGKAIEELQENRGVLYDAQIVDILIELVEESQYPFNVAV
ncbi:MAG: bacteriohemerythrin [Zetaproteobacteria bacterium]|nr:bacteriohemerythrin [Zetaproteobacteria bacterium]